MGTLFEEISEQPAGLASLRKYYTSPGAIPSRALRKLVTHWPPTVVFTGMGSSLFAAYPAQAYLTSQGVRALVWETAELLHHHLKVLGRDTLLVVVSQSGETAEIVGLLEALPKKIRFLALTNHEASTLARRSSLLLPMMAGAQCAVSTKTFMCSVAALMYLAFALARKPHGPLTQALMRAIDAQEGILDRYQDLTPPLVEFMGRPPYLALMSRGANLASVYQGSLLLKEVARLAAEPISAAQFRHGPIEIIDPSHRYVIFARRGVRSRPAGRSHPVEVGPILLRLVRDIHSHGGRVLLFSDMPFENLPGMSVVRVEPIGLGLGTLVDILHIELLAHDLASRAGHEPGKLRLAEDVTREE